MSNCSNHRRDLFGQTDMKVVAEAISDLHYETLAELFLHISNKLKMDSYKDSDKGRYQIASALGKAAGMTEMARRSLHEAWQISKPFMDNPTPAPQDYPPNNIDM